MTFTRTRAVLAPLLVSLMLLPLGACAEAPPIALDGSAREWPAGAGVIVESEHVYVRFSPPGEPITLQGGQRTTRLLFDTDADTTTGVEHRSGDETLGVDLEIQISPAGRDGAPGVGTGAWAFASNGQKVAFSPSEIGFMFSPTYSSREYEARVRRVIPEGLKRRLGSMTRTLGSTQRVRVRVVQIDRDGRELWASGVMEADAPPAGAKPPAGVLPPKAPAGIRVVSHNVLRSSPETNPGAFVRLYRALEPDVILVQEWDGWDSDRLAAWFNERVPIEGTWSAVAHESDRAGVAVVSRLPIREALTETVSAPGGKWPVRFVGAIVETREGPMLVGSMHLKCCGSSGSSEDERRLHETKAINEYVGRVMDEREIGLCALAGDLNLVGSRPPLDTLRGGLDADGSDLEPADAVVTGDSSRHTWTDDRSLFSPGRLDWLVYSDSTLRAAGAFALETERLSDDELRRVGLRRDDSRVSDHLAVVVDLVARD